MNRHHHKKYRLVPYQTLVLATQGNIEAIDVVLQHYRGYIITLAMKQVYVAVLTASWTMPSVADWKQSLSPRS